MVWRIAIDDNDDGGGDTKDAEDGDGDDNALT